VVVAVKLDVIEGCGDAVPTGHGSGLRAAHVGHGHHDDVAEAQRFADQDDFKFDRSANGELPGAEKIDAGRADVASDEGYGRFLGHSARTAKAQREVQSGPGVFPMFWMHAHGVRRHPDKSPRLRWAQKGRDAKGRDALQIRQRLRSRHNLARFSSWFGWPRFKWSCALRRAHYRPQTRHFTVAGSSPTNCTAELTFWNFPVHTCGVWSAKMALEEVSVNLWKTPEVS
jgi:hypothetical protein